MTLRWSENNEHLLDAVGQRVGLKARNLLSTHLRLWDRYSRFLETVQARYHSASAEYRDTFEDLSAANRQLPPSGTLTLEHQALWDRTIVCGEAVELEVESFYLFAKILVDRVADTIFQFFGIDWPAKGSSHSHLARQFNRLEQRAKTPSEMIGLAKEVQERIVTFRDDLIEHLDDPRHIRGSGLDEQNVAKLLFPTVLYPKTNESPLRKLSEDSREVIDLLDRYIAVAVKCLQDNLGKCVLESFKQTEPRQ